MASIGCCAAAQIVSNVGHQALHASADALTHSAGKIAAKVCSRVQQLVDRARALVTALQLHLAEQKDDTSAPRSPVDSGPKLPPTRWKVRSSSGLNANCSARTAYLC